MVQYDPTPNMDQMSLCLNPCNGFSSHSEWKLNSIQYTVSLAFCHLSDVTPLSSSAQCTPHSTSCLDTFFPVPPWLTLSPPPGLYTFLGRPVLPILEYRDHCPKSGILYPSSSSAYHTWHFTYLFLICFLHWNVSSMKARTWFYSLFYPLSWHAAANQVFTEWMKEFLHGFICSSRPSVFEWRENSLWELVRDN